MTNGRKTEESLNHRRNNKERNETDGVWNEGGEREGRRGGHGDKLERALTNGTATVFRIKMKPAQTTAKTNKRAARLKGGEQHKGYLLRGRRDSQAPAGDVRAEQEIQQAGGGSGRRVRVIPLLH